MQNSLNLSDIKKKLEHFCAYQERCHAEVIAKLRSMGTAQNDIDETVVYLISQNFLNEERFAQSFARGKHRIKSWGKSRIIAELKARNITQRNIDRALKEIPDDEYRDSFDRLAERHWETLRGPNDLKKRKKFCDYLLRKGYESNFVYEKAMELERRF